jgi:hypothetical protein
VPRSNEATSRLACRPELGGGAPAGSQARPGQRPGGTGAWQEPPAVNNGDIPASSRRHLPVSDYLSHIYHSMPPGLLLASGEYVAGGDLGPALNAAREAVSTPRTRPRPPPRPKPHRKRKDVSTSDRAHQQRKYATKKRAEVRQRRDLLNRHETATIPVMQQKIALLQALVQKQFVYARHQENLVSKIAMCSLTLSDIGLNSSSTALPTPSCRTSRWMFVMQ